MPRAIEVDHVSVWYGSPRSERRLMVLDDVSLDVEDEQFLTIVGPSGCGKTTLLRLLGGLMERTSGNIRIGGEPVTGPRPDVAVVFQGFELYPWRTVLQNVWLGLEIRQLDKRHRRERALEWIERVGLSGFEDRYPHELSGGMQQRVGLARALVVDPRVLLMDEPFGALDALTRDRMQREFLRLFEQTRKTVVFITHDIKEAIFLGDRVLVMSPRPATLALDLEVAIERPRWNRRIDVETDARFIEVERLVRKELGLEGAAADDEPERP